MPAFAKVVYDVLAENHPRTVIALPRDSAKTTMISKSYVLQQCLKRATYARIITNTPALAYDISNDHARQLTANPRLKQFTGRMHGSIWSSQQRLLANDSIIQYTSIRSSIRGANTHLGRPKLNILDDMEKVEASQSSLRQDEMDLRFLQDLMPGIPFDDGGRVIMLCNISDKQQIGYRACGEIDEFKKEVVHGLDDFYNGEIEGPLGKWRVLRLSACDFESGWVLWPERFNIEHFKEQRNMFAQAGQIHKFNGEYLNDPIDKESVTFPPEFINRISSNDVPQNLRMFMAVDMAQATHNKADYTAVVIGGTDEFNNLYVIHTSQHRWDPLERINGFLAYAEQYGIKTIHIEVGGNHDFYAHTMPLEMRRQNKYVSLVKLHPGSRNKQDRIEDLRPALQSMFFVKGATDEAYKQLTTWTRHSKAHDDLPDALAYLRQIAKQGSVVVDTREYYAANEIQREMYDRMRGLDDTSLSLYEDSKWR